MPTRAPPLSHALKVLLVEDDPDLRMLVTLAFRTRLPQSTLTTCSEGGAALDALRAGGFDLILSDLMMPGMDGASLAQHLAADPALSSIPMLICSSLSKGEYGALDTLPNVRAVLRKPMSPQQVIEEVVRVWAGLSGPDSQEGAESAI